MNKDIREALEYIEKAIADWSCGEIDDFVAISVILSKLYPIRANRADMEWADRVLKEFGKQWRVVNGTKMAK